MSCLYFHCQHRSLFIWNEALLTCGALLLWVRACWRHNNFHMMEPASAESCSLLRQPGKGSSLGDCWLHITAKEARLWDRRKAEAREHLVASNEFQLLGLDEWPPRIPGEFADVNSDLLSGIVAKSWRVRNWIHNQICHPPNRKQVHF